MVRVRSHRTYCLLGAFYIAFSTPLALALAPPIIDKQINTAPSYLRSVSLQEPLQSISLPEQSEVPLPVPPPPPAPVVSCGNNPYMAYIYMVESGCNTGSINYIGCVGLGQACPGSKLPCSLYDWACQDAWFRQYAVDAYGSIYNAYLFRTQNNWW